MSSPSQTEVSTDGPPTSIDPTEPADLLLRDLRASRGGLPSREAERRLVVSGTNELVRRGGRHWPTRLPSVDALLLLLAFPPVVWASDELYRSIRRRRTAR
jgi:hypothetical protein